MHYNNTRTFVEVVMSFNDLIWHKCKARKCVRIVYQRRYVGWIVYFLFGLVWLAYFKTTTINENDWHGMHSRNTPVTFCLASELAEESENIRPITLRSRERLSTIVGANPSELHETRKSAQSTVPLISKLKKQPPFEKLTLNQIMYRAGKRGLGGGIPGAIAGAIQVLSLMWLRTIINYQSRYGTTFLQALRTLLNEGGVARLYCGVSFALVQAPLARFVSTAANDGVESLLANLSFTKDWGPGRTTVVASIVVGFWRMLLMRTFLFHFANWFSYVSRH